MTILTNEQTQQLFQFCSRHYVQYYDVQAELVDHLGSAIEEKMDTAPGLSFEKALDQVFLSFGPKGFSSIVAEKIDALKKQNKMELRRIARSYLRWPSILLLAAAISLQWTLYRYGGIKILFGGIIGVTGGVFSILLSRLYKTRLRQVRPLLANDFLHSSLSFNFSVYLQMGFLLLQGLNFYNLLAKGDSGFFVGWILMTAWNLQIFYFICLLKGMRSNRLRLQRQYPLAFRG